MDELSLDLLDIEEKKGLLTDATDAANEARILITETNNSLHKLLHIKNTLDKYGVSEEIIQMADTYGEFSSLGIISSIESLHDLDEIAVMEGLVDTIKKAVRALKERLNNYFEKLKDKRRAEEALTLTSTEVLLKSIKRLNDIESFDPEKLKKSTISGEAWITNRKEAFQFVTKKLLPINLQGAGDAVTDLKKYFQKSIREKNYEWKCPPGVQKWYKSLLTLKSGFEKLFSIKIYLLLNEDKTIDQVKTSVTKVKVKSIPLSSTEFTTPEKCIEIAKEWLECKAVEDHNDAVDDLFGPITRLDDDTRTVYDRLDENGEDTVDIAEFMNDLTNELVYIEQTALHFNKFWFKYSRGLATCLITAVTCRSTKK